MSKVTLDSLDNQRVEGLMMDAVIRLWNSTKEGKYVFNTENSDMLCVARYAETVEKLKNVIIEYELLLNNDVENMYKVRTTLEVIDKEIARKMSE